MEHPLESIKKAALNGVLEYKASNTPEQIRIRVHQQLERIEQEVVLSLLGLTSKWGKIELDSNPDSPVRKKLIGQKELFIEKCLFLVCKKIRVFSGTFKQLFTV